MATQDRVVHWTRPILDAARKTLRTTAVRGLISHGAFVGVAGCDMRVSALASKLKLALPGFRHAYLVMEDGKFAASETLEEAMLAQGQGRRQRPRPAERGQPELAARIAKHELGGYLASGPRLLVFSRMISPPGRTSPSSIARPIWAIDPVVARTVRLSALTGRHGGFVRV
jgi:hypothetical protein